MTHANPERYRQFCDNDFGGYGASADSECNTACSGDAGTMCGGPWRNSVYSLAEGQERPRKPPRPTVASSGGH